MTAFPVQPASEGGWIRYAAVILSILLHILLLADYGGSPAHTIAQPNPPIIQVSFLPPVPEPVRQPETVPEKPEVKQKPKPEPVPEPKPKPVRKVVKKTIVEKTEEPQRQAVVEEAVAKPEPVAISVPVVAVQVKPVVDKGLIKRETDRYITKMMAHIEQYKRYPKAARRRGLEGDIIVRFTLFPDGTVDRLVVENGPSLLVSAARRAVERAMPMPIPPATIHCPLECQFRMAFHLTRS